MARLSNSDVVTAYNAANGTAFDAAWVDAQRKVGKVFRTVDNVMTMFDKDNVPTAKTAKTTSDGTEKTAKTTRKSRVESWKVRQLSELYGKSLDFAERARETVADETDLESKIIKMRDDLESKIKTMRENAGKEVTAKRAEHEKNAADMLTAYRAMCTAWNVSADDSAAIMADVVTARTSENKDVAPTTSENADNA